MDGNMDWKRAVASAMCSALPKLAITSSGGVLKAAGGARYCAAALLTSAHELQLRTRKTSVGPRGMRATRT